MEDAEAITRNAVLLLNLFGDVRMTCCEQGGLEAECFNLEMGLVGTFFPESVTHYE